MLATVEKLVETSKNPGKAASKAKNAKEPLGKWMT